MKFAALVGTTRKESYNKKLMNYMKTRYAEQAEIEILPIEELPLYTQDSEEHPAQSVKDFKRKVAECDGLIIATAEYNHSIPAILKNAIDWCSRVDKVLINKPVMLLGASMGMHGTVRAQMHLRQVLNAPGVSALVLPGNEVFVGTVQNKMDESGRLIDESTIQFIDGVVDHFINWVELTSRTY